MSLLLTCLTSTSFDPRRDVQQSLLFEFGFLQRLMLELRTNSEASQSEIKSDADLAAEIGNVEPKVLDREDERTLLAGSRCPLLGHLVQIAQVTTTPFHQERPDEHLLCHLD